MKSRVFFLGLLSLLWISSIEASVDFMSDIPVETVDSLRAIQMHRALTETASINDQLTLFKGIPGYFSDKAKELIRFKEVPVARPSQKVTPEADDLAEKDEDSPRSPVAVDTSTEIIAYDEEEMISCITRFCFPEAALHYEQGMRALFRSGKTPKHDARHLTEGLQCLGGKMLFARALVEKIGLDEGIGNSLQLAAINQLFKFHKPTLAETSPALVSAIPTEIPGCSRCLGLPKLSN